MDVTFRILASSGSLAALLALIAWLGDRRRMRRTNLDRVGFVPWTGLFFIALVAALILLGLPGRLWFRA